MVADTSSTLAMIRGDSARAAAAVYTLVVLSTVPFIGAALASVALRRATAGARLLAWRSAVVALLLLALGRLLPVHSLAWTIPPALAGPLVALGRVQVTAGTLAPLRTLVAGGHVATGSYAGAMVQALLVVYLAGVMIVLIPTAVASVRMRRALRGARTLSDAAGDVADTCHALRIGRAVRVLVSPVAPVPMTWGLLAPVVLLPEAAGCWSRAERHIVLLHELTHVKASDWTFNIAARAMCALYWFHPAAWWIARSLREECELACDDRVIAAGVRRSDYAELLVHAAHALRPHGAPRAAVALSERSGLRARLAALLDVRRDTRPLAPVWAPVAAAITIAIAAPMSAVQLAPTRDVLTTLMSDTRWESRAYAVLGLAQRSDSVAVARSAAERDPSPRVRAWARYALGETTQRPVDASPTERKYGR